MIYVLFAVAMLSLATGGVFSILWLRLRTQHSSLQELERNYSKLDLRIQEIEAHRDTYKQDFESSLEQAGITNRIKVFDAGFSSPQRYKYVNSLVEQGLTSLQIAEILKVSSQEADQLVRLSQIALEDRDIEATED
ncbi:MAG TPA: hypothetical protein VKN82_07815 [Desulfohalobiaceae bacterium]|nr:hypothetical protein [Desulfohalobiaceae bacterium]